MPAPYIHEQQTADWTSEDVKSAFENNKFEVRDWHLTQHLEKEVPADWVFFSPKFTKLFGFQYKTLYRNGRDFWKLDSTQHKTLKLHPWIFYCCSELKDVTDRGMALHSARIYSPKFRFRAELGREGLPYYRWGSFYRLLKECKVGKKIRSLDELRQLFKPLKGEARIVEVNRMGEFLLTDFDRRVVFRERLF